MVGKPYVSAFQNFFRIENPLNIKPLCAPYAPPRAPYAPLATIDLDLKFLGVGWWQVGWVSGWVNRSVGGQVGWLDYWE